MVVASLLFAALCVVASFGFAGIVCMAAGVGVVLYSFPLFLTDFATALYFAGSGVLTVGIGGILARFGWWMCGLFVKGAKYAAMFFFNRIRKNEGGQHA
jgi:hypothetical protein